MTKYRLVIWGPGEVGGATLRAAHADPRFEIVGAKVFSPHKHGKDAGELVGIGPIGVRATRSKAEILALNADCVLLAPRPTAIMEGLDRDVIDILESGKSVVTTAAYHNVAMPNWHNSLRSPTALLRAMTRLGAVRTQAEARALQVGRALTAVPQLDRVTDPLLRSLADARFPARATPERLAQACRRGGASLHGTGVHPTFMVERQIMHLCRLLPQVAHIRFVEAVDFGLAPEGMWGGLELFGFGADPARIGDDSMLAKAGDFYYGDLTGNVGHALYGAMPEDVRVERSLRGRPAANDLQVGGTFVAQGAVAAMHMTHRGYLSDRHFFTNEESWYLTPDNAFHGEALPYGNHNPHGGYSFEITGEPGVVRGQIGSTMNVELLRLGHNPITTMSVNAMLAAVGPVCESEPGVVIDDARPSYRPGPGTGLYGFTLGRTLATMTQGFANIRHIDLTESLETPDGLSDSAVRRAEEQRRTAITAAGADLFGTVPDTIDTMTETTERTTVLTVHARLAGRDVLTSRTHWHRGEQPTDLPYGQFQAPVGYAARIQGEPGELAAQWEIDGPVQGLVGDRAEDPMPRYKLDNRVHR